MTWQRYTLESYLNRELRFWKSLKAVYINRGGADKVLRKLRQRFKDERIMEFAAKHFRSMALIVRLFKPEYVELITKRVNEEFGTDFHDALDLKSIQEWQPEDHPASSLAFGWIEIAIAVVIIVIVIVAEANDNDGAGEDDTVIVTVGTEALKNLVEESAYLECEEIASLDYGAWTTYLLMIQLRSNVSQYIVALVCGSCNNLRTLVESFNHNHELILPDGISWLGALFYAARLEECGIPY